MYKAFLAHSDHDKPYTDIVARRLTRARVVYDEQDFAPGSDFRDSIRDGLDQSSLFVLFASEQSLRSTWVRFEIDEAEMRKMSGKLQGILVFIIDPKLGFGDLPNWMTRGRVAKEARPSQAARLILTQLIYQIGKEATPLFVGREDLLRDTARDMVPSGGQRPPQLIVASGLDGVGRRSIVRRALRDNLSLEFGPVLALNETDGPEKLYLLLLEETMELDSRSDMAEAVARFSRADVNQRARLIAEEIGTIAKDNVVTVVVDEGALIDEEGGFVPELAGVFECIGEDKREPYLVLVRRRRPADYVAKFGQAQLITISVPPLSLESTKRLLAQSLKTALITASPEQIDELAPYLDGYPPAVQIAVDFARVYGLGVLLADKSILVDFKVRTFARILERLGLQSEEQRIVRMLGLEPAISLGVLSTMTGTSPEALAPLVKRFIDRNIVVQSAGQLSLAAPLRDVVYRSYGLLSRTEFAQMAERLKQEYWSDASKVPPLDAVDATIYTVARGLPQQFAGFSDITMPSQLLNIAVKAYHEREWKIAQDFAVRAVAANAQPQRAFSTLCKASVRLAHEGLQEWAVAERRVAEAEKHHVKGHQYLRGFMEWKRNNLEAAVEAYGEAIKGGYRDVSVYRDRAHCLYRLHRFEEAEKDIAVALERYPRNNFVVDLAAAIAIARGQYGKAERLISELETIDVKENFHHRRASLRAARGQFEAALADSEVACQRVPPLHEILAQRIDLLIELGQHDRAGTEIEQLARDFGGRSFRNVQFGLRCKMSLRKGNWREAEAHYAHLQDTDLPVHRGLQIEILRQKVADHTVAPAEVEKAKIELENLRDLISLEGLWPSLAGPGDLDGPTGED